MIEDRLTIKIDAATKQELKIFADSIGLTSSRMVRVLIKQALRERRILLLNKDPAVTIKELLAQQEIVEDLD